MDFVSVLQSTEEPNEVVAIVNDMLKDNVMPSMHFVRDHILAAMNFDIAPDFALAKLMLTDLKPIIVAKAAVDRALKNNDLRTCHEVLIRNRDKYINPHHINNQIVKAFYQSKNNTDLAKVLRILQYIIANQSILKLPGSASDIKQEQKHSIGRVLFNCVGMIKNNPEQVQELLLAAVQQQIAISSEWKENFIKNFNDKTLTKTSKELIGQLASNDPANIIPDKYDNLVNQLLSSDIQTLIDKNIQNGRNTDKLRRRLLEAYIEESKIDKFEAILASEKYILSKYENQEAIRAYVLGEHMDKAYDLLIKCRNEDVTFYVSKKYLLAIAGHFLRKNEQEKAIKILTTFVCNVPNVFDSNINAVRDFMEQVIATKDNQLTDQFLKLLVKNNYMLPSGATLEPLIRLHLNQNDLRSALNRFESIQKSKKIRTGLIPIVRKAIDSNEHRSLDEFILMQRTNQHKNEIALFALTHYVDIGDTSSARQILSQYHFDSEEIGSVCEYYKRYARDDVLENLIKLTESLNIDQMPMYLSLLKVYCHRRDYKKAYALWQSVRQHKKFYSKEFPIVLKCSMVEDDMDVPDSLNDDIHGKQETHIVTQSNDILTAAIQSGDVQRTLLEWKKLQSAISFQPSPNQISNILRFLLNENEHKQMIDIIINLLHSKLYNTKSTILETFVKYLVEIKDFDGLLRLADFIPVEKASHIMLPRCLYQMHANCNKLDVYFTKFNQEIIKADNPKERIRINASIPRRDHLALLLQRPDFAPKCKHFLFINYFNSLIINLNYFSVLFFVDNALAQKASMKKISYPLTVYWAFNFVQGEREFCENHTTTFSANFIISHLMKSQQYQKIDEFIEFVQTHGNSMDTKYVLENAFHLYLQRGRVDDAVKMFDLAEQNSYIIDNNLVYHFHRLMSGNRNK